MAHIASELNKHKSRLCRDFENGKCGPSEKCKYAHGIDELRVATKHTKIKKLSVPARTPTSAPTPRNGAIPVPTPTPAATIPQSLPPHAPVPTIVFYISSTGPAWARIDASDSESEQIAPTPRPPPAAQIPESFIDLAPASAVRSMVYVSPTGPSWAEIVDDADGESEQIPPTPQPSSAAQIPESFIDLASASAVRAMVYVSPTGPAWADVDDSDGDSPQIPFSAGTGRAGASRSVNDAVRGLGAKQDTENMPAASSSTAAGVGTPPRSSEARSAKSTRRLWADITEEEEEPDCFSWISDRHHQ